MEDDIVTDVKPSKIKISLPKQLVEFDTDKESFDLEAMTHRCNVRYNASFVEDVDTYAKFEGNDSIVIFRKI